MIPGRLLHILIIEDMEDDHQLLLLEFKRRGLEVASLRVEKAEIEGESGGKPKKLRRRRSACCRKPAHRARGQLEFLLPDSPLQYSDEMYRLLDIRQGDFNHRFNDLMDQSYSVDRPEHGTMARKHQSCGGTCELTVRFFRKSGELRHIRFTGGRIFRPDGQDRPHQRQCPGYYRKQAGGDPDTTTVEPAGIR